MPRGQQPESIDLNILPEQYRPRVISPIIRLLWTIAAALLVLLVPSFIFMRHTKAQVADLTRQLDEAQTTLRMIRTPAPELVGLTDELTQTLHSIDVIQSIYSEAFSGRQDWPIVFEALLSYDSERIRPIELYQDADDLMLAGVALKRDDVLALAGTLDRSGAFQQVIIQSMENSDKPFEAGAATLTPAVVPTGSVTATLPALVPSATPTAGPEVLYDAYEIDDFEPKPISVGEVQRHSFYPVYDVDQVVFLGKAGRRYCVRALPEALGVDTYLEVTVAGSGYTNDDCYSDEAVLLSCSCPTGTVTSRLASLVEIQIPLPDDQQVRVRASNRDQYGPDQWYTLLVYEAAGDPWEKDDLVPKPIGIGEIQQRTFYPEGDVDRMTFPVKAGHAYALRTSGLSVGVDTLLAVFANGVAYQNDDVSSGDRASLVEFQAIADGEASASVTNKGSFGVGMGYTLELQEIGGDPYEPDDYAPRPISIWEKQKHTFYPENDIDRVEFGIKGGHVYEFKTYSLTVGVDTVVSILADGVVYQNDDISPGNQASHVSFTAARDGKASVTITNREQYGVSNEYWLTLVELAGTPTPDLTQIPATPGPTPTPDCNDAYEPDDLIPHLMAVGDVQEHTFCASGDVDRVVFTAKTGYSYQIETFDLSLGVDTYLSAQIGSITLTNDDYAPQNLSSMVQVSNTTSADAPVYVTVMNKGLFGKDLDGNPRAYKLKVVDMDLSQGDEYEAEEAENPDGAKIAFGMPQNHNFAPNDDVDKVYFMTEPGHAYYVYTKDLAPGVDTKMVVDITVLDVDTERWVHLENDDEGPGALSSRVAFRYEGTDYGKAVATISQKGLYGVDKTYVLQVVDVADGYEPDDVLGVPISIGGPDQLRNFDPAGDVDRVYFVAKAGHRYAIHTDNLGVLVDTMLTVDMGPVHLTNDDKIPGDLSSYVELQNDGTSDSQAVVTIANKGQYGPTRSYTLRVDDLGTESADEYEPDLTVKRYISVGEAQRHTFHPNLDTDRVVLQVKAGRRYSVFTCGGETIPSVAVTYTTPFEPTYLECDLLPVGVDTVLVLSGPIYQCEPASCQSDDVLPGSDYLNSRVEFEALTDGEVTITIYNKGLFGPTMEYYIRVHEIGALPPTPVSASPTPYYSPTPTLTATPIPPVTVTVTPPYVPPLTPTATPTPTETPVPTPTATHTPGSYPFSLDSRDSLWHIAYAGVPHRLAVSTRHEAVNTRSGGTDTGHEAVSTRSESTDTGHEVVSTSHRAVWRSKPLLAYQGQTQDVGGGTIGFVLLLRMKPVAP